MARKPYPGIPQPDRGQDNILASMRPMKEAIEILTGQRGDVAHRAVTWQDLLDLELIEEDQVPTE